MRMETVCIVCPNSCRLSICDDTGETIVSGNECKRGVAHGLAEFTCPTRMLTTTVAIKGGVLPRLPVISTGEIAKTELQACLRLLYEIKVVAPVTCGDVIMQNIAGTGVDMIASRSMRKVG